MGHLAELVSCPVIVVVERWLRVGGLKSVRRGRARCGADDEQVSYGKLSLIDLAGSERAAASDNRGIRMIEVCILLSHRSVFLRHPPLVGFTIL